MTKIIWEEKNVLKHSGGQDLQARCMDLDLVYFHAAEFVSSTSCWGLFLSFPFRLPDPPQAQRSFPPKGQAGGHHSHVLPERPVPHMLPGRPVPHVLSGRPVFRHLHMKLLAALPPGATLEDAL